MLVIRIQASKMTVCPLKVTLWMCPWLPGLFELPVFRDMWKTDWLLQT